MLRIAITGPQGFIGRHLIQALAHHQLVLMDRSKGADVRDLSSLEAFGPLDIIIHLAALSYVPDSYDNPHGFYESNAAGTLNVLELARKAKARVIHLSSYIYGHPQYLPIDEEHPLEAANPYAHSKLISEEFCRAYTTHHNCDVCIIRPFNLYGPGQDSKFVIPKMVQSALRREPIELFDLRPKRDYLYVTDLVSLICRIIDNPVPGLVTVNAGSGESTSLSAVASIIAELLGRQIEIIDAKRPRPNEILDCIASTERANSLYGWSSSTSLQDGLSKVISDLVSCTK